MKFWHLKIFLAPACIFYVISITGSGCAQIGAPTGGPRDSLPPVLVSASPDLFTTGFTANKITLNFNEYMDVQDVQNNVLVSPFPKVNPTVEFKLKTVTVKIKDTLLPNTTYSINFGNALRDNNEGNPFRNFTYVFSTGTWIDSLQQSGKVIVAETGKKDSTIVAMLYRNVDDSAVQKRKPDYLAKLDSSGNFHFRNLSEGRYRIYALKDGDGGKTYNSKIEMFAFADSDIVIGTRNNPVTLYAYAEEKDTRKTTTAAPAPAKTGQVDKRLRFTSTLTNNQQDLLSDLVLSFNKPLKQFDPQKIVLADTNLAQITASISLDSTRKNIHVKTPWKEDNHYLLILPKDAVADSTGLELPRPDTIRFSSKKETDYGSLVIRFNNTQNAKNAILQFVQGEDIYRSVPITGPQWTDRMFPPGEYELRILFDENNNAKWDPGNYHERLQPERAIAVGTKLNIKANWDNERDIRF